MCRTKSVQRLYLHWVQPDVIAVICSVRRSASSHPHRLIALVERQRRGSSRGGQDGLLHGGALALLQNQRVWRGLETRWDTGGTKERGKEGQQGFIKHTCMNMYVEHLRYTQICHVTLPVRWELSVRADAVDFRFNILHGKLVFRHQVHFVLKTRRRNAQVGFSTSVHKCWRDSSINRKWINVC